MSRVKQITLAGVATDVDGLFVSASVDGEATLLAASTGLDPPRMVTLTSGATDNSGDTARITGTDRYGNIITEDLVAPAATLTVTSIKVYATVTSINLLTATVALSGGWGNTTFSQWVPLDTRVSRFAVAATVVIAAGTTLEVDVERTYENLQRDPATGALRTEEVVVDDLHDDPVLAALTATARVTITDPVTAVRLNLNSWTSGTPILRLVQARFN